MMKFYLAPMEGITSYIYRNAHVAVFGKMDKYFTPFIAANPSGHLSTRDQKEMSLEHNKGLNIVPQILTNQTKDFLETAKALESLGYKEVNLNLGCPSGTVVSKGRGAGFLAYPEALQAFLEEIFAKAQVEISIKTRIGKDSPHEFMRLLQIYNQYPLKELIIHPRVQKDYYKNKPNWEAFGEGMKGSKHPIVYNGDIYTAEDYHKLKEHFKGLDCVMLGRGVIANPGLVNEIKGSCGLNKNDLKTFHDLLCEGYIEKMQGEKNVLFKMKEVWFYMGYMFTNADKYLKKIKKSQKLVDYENAVNSLFQEQNIVEAGGLFCKTEE